MKKLIVLLSVLAIAVPVLASELTVADPRPLNAGNIGGDTRATLVYDNTTTVTSAYQQPTGTEFGDEVTPNWTGAGNILDTLKWSLYNPSGQATIASATPTVKFYDYDGASPSLLFTINYNPIAVALPAGYYTTISSTGLSSLNLAIPTNITYLLWTVTWTNTGVANCGQVLANPPAVGSSGDYFDKNVGGTWGYYWFGGSPVANFYFQIGTTPEPTALGLLALGGLALLRRR